MNYLEEAESHFQGTEWSLVIDNPYNGHVK